MRWLGADMQHCAWTYLVEGREDGASEWYDGLHSVITRNDDEQPKTGPRYVLLVLKIAVHGDQHLKTGRGGSSQRLTILDAGPARLDHGLDVVAWELGCQRPRHRLIEENVHPSAGLRGPSRERQRPARR